MYYWIAGIVLLVLVGVGIYSASKPDFWIGVAKNLGKKFVKNILPDIRAYVAKRNTEDIEAKMRECVRRGGEWDNFNKKCRYK